MKITYTLIAMCLISLASIDISLNKKINFQKHKIEILTNHIKEK